METKLSIVGSVHDPDLYFCRHIAYVSISFYLFLFFYSYDFILMILLNFRELQKNILENLMLILKHFLK